jgi:hypothetical protein
MIDEGGTSMKLRMSVLGALSLTLALAAAGCSTPQGTVIKSQTRELSMPMDQAFDTVKNAMFSSGHAITYADRREGLLTTEYVVRKRSFGLALGFWIIVPMVFFDFSGEQPTYHASFLLTDRGPAKTRIRVMVEGQEDEGDLTDQILGVIEKEAQLLEQQDGSN